MLKKHFGFIILFVLVAIIAITNFTPNTYLTGWDNLHPEFDFGLNIKRAIFSSWQEYQGLGLSGGMGHSSELPRQIFLWILSFIFPVESLRYIYHFLMLFAGASGVYVLLKMIVLWGLRKRDREMASTIGGIFYVFNLATLQMFFVPFEPFSHHFAALPWIFFGILSFLKTPGRKSLFLLFIINLLAVPQGFVATYFLVTVMVLSIFFFFYFLKKREVKKIIVCFLMLFFVNAFWLFPNLYFLINKADINVNAKINQMSTEDNFLKNKQYGNLQNTLLFKGFWFDNVETNIDGRLTYQMQDWISYLNNPVVKLTGYSLFLVSLGGMIFSLKKRRGRELFFVPVFLFSFTILSNDTFILSQIGLLFYKVPLFSQIFRFPFTKFAIVAVFCLSVFYSLFYVYLLTLNKGKRFYLFSFLVMAILPLILLLPAFSGKFFDPKNRVEIPEEYFKVFEFFKKQDKNDRIANFPQYSFWGWSFYQWGYRGSGLLWYGIEQPVIDRAFDVWGSENENYYHEISYAAYSGNKKLLEYLLEKYQVRWILIDKNVISFASQRQIYFSDIDKIIEKSPKISLAENFGNISIYKVKLSADSKNYIKVAEDLPNVFPRYNWNNYDSAYLEYGDYVYNDNIETINNKRVYYPLRSIFTNKSQKEQEFAVVDKGSYFSFVSKIPEEFLDGKLIVPKFYEEEVIEIDKDLLATYKYPKIYIDGQLVSVSFEENRKILREITKETPENIGDENYILSGVEKGILEIRIPKIKGNYSYDSYNKNRINKYKSTPCNPFNRGKFMSEQLTEEDKTIFRMTSVGSSNCFDIDLPAFSQRLSYLVKIESKNISGKSLLFAVVNKNSQRADIESYLPVNKTKAVSYFIIPPMQDFGLGYSLHFDNISIGRVKTVNELETITVNPVPFRFLTSLRIVKNELQQQSIVDSSVFNIERFNPSYYKVFFKKNIPIENKTLVLSQSFDEGWKAYRIQNSESGIQNWFKHNLPFLFGEKIEDHVLVNNWANGWNIQDQKSNIKDQKQIVILFWPQYLEYAGFGLLVIVPMLIWRFHKYLS